MQTYDDYLKTVPKGQTALSQKEFEQSLVDKEDKEIEKLRSDEQMLSDAEKIAENIDDNEMITIGVSGDLATEIGKEGYRGSTRLKKEDLLTSKTLMNKAYEYIDTVTADDFIKYDENQLKDTAAELYFGPIDDYETEYTWDKTKSKLDPRGRYYGYNLVAEVNNANERGEYKTEEEYQAALTAAQRKANKKFGSQEDYDKYLRETLGDKYASYIKYQKGEDVEMDDYAVQRAKEKLFAEELNRFNRSEKGFGGKYGDEIQEVVKILKGDIKSREDAFKATEVTKDLINAKAASIEKQEAELEKKQKPFVDAIDEAGKKITDTFGENYQDFGRRYSDGKLMGMNDDLFMSEEEFEEKKVLYKQYMEDYSNAYDEYTKQDFEAQYDILIKNSENLNVLVNKYTKDVEAIANSSDKDYLIAKASGFDYSLKGRAAAAMEDFFIKGGRNVLNLTGQLGLKAIKALTFNPALDLQIDKTIKNMSDGIANYNQRLAEHRAETLPPALTLDDVEFGADGSGVLRYVGEALADNSPSILTTFIPAGLAIKGAAGVARATQLVKAARIGKGGVRLHGNAKAVQAANTAYREALAAQKTYGLYGMRAAQGIFFAGESGGKYGDIVVEEYNMRDRVDEINERLKIESLPEDERKALIEEKEETNNTLSNNYSFARKAFSSYGFGAVATVAETMGSLSLVSGVQKAARSYAKKEIKKELYTNATNFTGVLAGTVIKGLRPAVTKAMPSEVFEEAFTQVGHNAIDIVALNEDKSMLEGLNADFFVKTAITSFAIMAPTTMSNTRQMLQDEFKTRDEMLDNKSDVHRLITIQGRLNSGALDTREKRAFYNAEKKALVKKLGFYDAQVMQKLNHMTEAEIQEVGDINQKQRFLDKQMKGLAATGGSLEQDKVFEKTKQDLRKESEALETRKNELLNRKTENVLENQKRLNEKYGTSPNIDLAYTLGLNDFANDAALTMSDKNKKFTQISSESFQNPAAIRAELEAAGYEAADIDLIVDKFIGETQSNAMYLPNGDIIINQGAIDARMHSSSYSDGNYAALAPLEELFHATIKSKGLKVEGLLKKDAALATNELLELIKSKMETGTPKQKKDLQDLLERVEMYKSNGEYNYEEMLAQINNGMMLGVINASDFQALPSFKSFLNGAIQKILGDPSWMLELNTASDVNQFMNNWRGNILEGKAGIDQTPPEDEIVNAKPNIKDDKAMESVGQVIPEATQAYMDLDNSMLQQGLNSAIQNETDQRFPLAQALVEKNWPLISKSLNINNQQEMEAAKEVVIDQILGQFEGSGQGKYGPRNTSALAGFDLEGGAQVSTYLAETIRTRKPEIDAAIADRTGGPGIQVDQVGDVVTQTETTEVATVKPTPSQTTKFSEDILARAQTDKAGLETRITEAVQESYPGRTDVKLAETRNIPEKVAKVYTDMLEITNPNRLTDKSQTFSVTDEAGLRNAQVFLTQNAQADFANLPKALDASGKGTFIPLNVKRALYTDGKKTGSLKDYLDLIKIPATKKIYRDSAKVGTIRGLLSLHIRNRMLETAQPDSAKRKAGGAQFSKGKKINLNKYKEIARVKDKNAANDIIGTKTKITQDNIKKVQSEVQNAIETKGLNENTFNAARFNNSGAKRTRLENGDIVYDLSNGKKIKGVAVMETVNGRRRQKRGKPNKKFPKGPKLFKQPTLPQIEAEFGKGVTLVPDRNRLYYGVNDPAYIKARDAAIKNNKKGQKTFKRVSVKNAFTEKGQKQSAINMDILEETALELENAVANGMPLSIAAIIIEGAYQSTNGLIKIAAPFKYKSIKPEYAKDGKKSDRQGKKYREEHSPPASVIGASLLLAIKNGNVKDVMSSIRDNFIQIQLSKKDDTKIDNAGFASILPEDTSIFTPNIAAIRLAASDIDLNSIVNPLTGKTMAEEAGLPIKNKADINLESVNYQNRLLVDVARGDLDLDAAKARLKKSLPVQNAKANVASENANDFDVIVNKEQRSQQQKDVMIASMESRGKAIERVKPTKGISVFDFDDTLAKTKEKVIVNMPNGETREISASEFAETAGQLEAEGAEFDFKNFENVAKDTQEGPLADLARKRQGKFGSGDIFVLTARPNSAGPAIQKFLKSIGINIPLKNITGLADGSPQAKVDFILNKTAEGYNDFYFADDSFANVEGVKQVLNALDVKNEVQQAMESKGRKLNQEFNKQIEEVTGVGEFKQYSTARARLEGKKKDGGLIKRFIRQFKITPSADDFLGLMYAVVGKGEQGNKHLKFIKDNLVDVYDKAERQLLSAKVAVARDFAALRKKFPSLKGSKLNFRNPLLKEIDGGPFNKEQAVRVYIWNKQGNDIPDMSKRDINRLVKAVEADPELSVFADELQLIQKGKTYPAPGKNWLGGSVKNDILDGLDTSFRAELMKEFNENVDAIFDDAMFNKLEAVYGSKYVEALKDSLRRMKSGSNRPVMVGAGAALVNEMLDWLNASVANVMFLNMRSGLLQTLSAVNFINWGDNNIVNAAKAFASKEMWPTFMRLINSDYLVNRRDGLKINVNEAELADAAKKGGIKGAFSYLLDKGFAITRIMDSFAIALGGSTFFINRKKALLNRVNPKTGKKYTEAEADEQAFADFYAIAEETQQSSNPSKISSQQASFAGRLLLSFQNVTMQYNRKTKKSIQDLYNRRKKPGMTQRESDMSNLSSIVYYVGMQNLMFNALQQAMFAMLFDEEDEDKRKDDRVARTLNGMADSLLFGFGFGGAIVSTTKNILMRVAEESGKNKPDYRDIPDDVFDVSSVIDAKYRKLKTAARTFTFNRDEIKRRGWSLDNPAYLAVAQIISAVTNAPVDRVLQKVNNLRQASDESVRMWKRVALTLGWNGWNFNLPYWGRESTVEREAKEDAKIKENYEKQVKEVKSKGFTKKIPMEGPNHYKPKGELGVDYMQVERPSGIIQYYVKP